MGRKLDALLGRNLKTSKFKTLTKLAVSRVAILKNKRQARYSQAISDVAELLNLGHHERALARVEYVMREQNMVDALVMVEDYCHLLIERVMLIEKSKECPDELKEAISSLIFASSRCGELPELWKIREILTMRIGKEFAARAVELRNDCGVNPKVVQKFSLRQSSLESRLKVLKEISTDMGITLHLEEEALAPIEEKLNIELKQPFPTEPAICIDLELKDDTRNLPLELNQDEKLSESVKARKNYRDVAAAAHDAFESAAYAAAAARAAFELSRSESKDNDSDDDNGSTHRPISESNSDRSLTRTFKSEEYAVIESNEDSNGRAGFDKIHSIHNFGSESVGELEEVGKKAGRGRTVFASSSDSDEDILSPIKQFSSFQCRNEVASDDIDYNKGENQDNMPQQGHNDLDFNSMDSLFPIGYLHNQEYNGADEQFPSDEDRDNKHQSSIVDSPKSADVPMVEPVERKTKLTSTQDFAKQLHSQHSSTDWKKYSMRTRRLQRV